jgi:hypothetical protein
MEHSIMVKANGDIYHVVVNPWRTLNHILCEKLNLKGTKLGYNSGGLRGLHSLAGRQIGQFPSGSHSSRGTDKEKIHEFEHIYSSLFGFARRQELAKE